MDWSTPAIPYNEITGFSRIVRERYKMMAGKMVLTRVPDFAVTVTISGYRMKLQARRAGIPTTSFLFIKKVYYYYYYFFSDL